MQQPVKRQTAYYCTAQILHEGTYVRKEGWEPNLLICDGCAYARIRLCGIIVAKLEDNQLTLDDGTGSIQLRFFDTTPSVGVGDPVLVIGRPAEYGGDRYVRVELIKKTTPVWLRQCAVEREALKKFIPTPPPQEVSTQQPQKQVQESQEALQPVKNKATALIDAIRELDSGDGAFIDDVIKKVGFSDAEDRLQFLIQEGEVFEIRAGKIKVMD